MTMGSLPLFLTFLLLPVPFQKDGGLPARGRAPETGRGEGKAAVLGLEDLFPEGGLFGPTPRAPAFAADSRTAAFLWRPRRERRHGNDLYLCDVETGAVKRLTSAGILAAFFRADRKVVRARRAALKALAKRTGKEGEELTEAFWEADAKDKKGPKHSGVRAFLWSPKGRRLLFLSRGDVFTWEEKEGIRRFTRTSRVVSELRWMPDGEGFWLREDRRLAAVRLRDSRRIEWDLGLGPKDALLAWEPDPGGRRIAIVARKIAGKDPEPREVGIASYRKRFLEVKKVKRRVADDPPSARDFTVSVLDLEGAMREKHEPVTVFRRRITGPRDLCLKPDWSPDGSRFCFTEFTQKTSLVVLHEVRLPPPSKAGGGKEKESPPASKGAGKEGLPESRILFRWLHTGGPNSPRRFRPRYLADGRRILLPNEISGFLHLSVFDPLYESLAALTSGPYEVLPLHLSKDRRKVFVQASKEGLERIDLYRLSLEGKGMRRLSKDRGCHRNAAFSPDGRYALCNLSAYGRLPALILIDTKTGRRRTILSDHRKEAAGLCARRPRFFTYENRHGQRIHGFLFTPPGRRKGTKLPLLVYVYGGPLRPFAKNVQEGNYGGSPYLFARYMAERHGYLTCTIDPRGMSGYGGLFEKSNFEHVGRPQVEDLVDGVRRLVREYDVDPDRVGIHGWSFGGFQTQLCLYLAPKVFRAGIAGAGPTEWENYNSWYATGTIGPSRPGKLDLSRYSLLPLAKNLEGELLLLHGMEDGNVLFQDTVRIYRALLEAGKGLQVELFLDPTGGHGLGGSIKRIDRYRKYEEFLLRTLGEGPKRRI